MGKDLRNMGKEQIFLGKNSVYSVLDSANIWLHGIDINGNTTFFNRYAEKISGYSREYFLNNLNEWDYLFEDKNAGQKFKNVCCKMMASHKEFEGKEVSIISAEGKKVDISWSMNLIFDKEQVVRGCMLIGINISYRREFISKLSKSEEKYHTIFDHAPLGFFRSLPEGKFLEVNTTYAKMLGFSKPAEVLQFVTDIGTNIYDDPQIRRTIINETLRSKGICIFETKFKKRNGSTFDVRINIKARIDPLINSRVLEGTIEDITLLKAEQKALRKSESQLVSLLKAMNDVVIMFDKYGNYLFVAPTASNLLIAPKEQLEGKNISEFFDKKSVDSFLSVINQCLEKKETVKFEYPITIAGNTIWFDAMISPVSDNAVTWVARDITSRRLNEKVNAAMLNISKAVNTSDNLDELFDNISHELSSIIDTKNFFIALYDSETNTMTLPYFRDEKDKFDSFPAEKTLSSLVVNQKKSVYLKKAEINNLAKQGKINLVGTTAEVWIGIPLMVEGEVLGVMVVQNYDHKEAFNEEHFKLLEVISPQISLSIKHKHSEQLLKNSEKMLRESNLTKDRFFNIIAHDLKNPFNAIIGFSNLLIDEWSDFDNDEKISMINSIKSSSEGAYELLMNLLDWSRLQVGKINYEPQFIDIAGLIKLNFSLLKTNADSKNITMHTAENCDKMVWADANMINTVIRNLLSNAIKFTKENGIIKVRCNKSADYPGKIILAISDSGVGFDTSITPDLFNFSSSQSS
nr:PAS domain S-box protein [Bacteroidota bacterium]